MTDADRFIAGGPVLLGLAYRLLGSAADAEEIVQDAYLHALGARPVGRLRNTTDGARKAERSCATRGWRCRRRGWRRCLDEDRARVRTIVRATADTTRVNVAAEGDWALYG